MRMRAAVLILVLAALIAVPAMAEVKTTVGGWTRYGAEVQIGVTPLAASEAVYQRVIVSSTIDDFVTAYARIDLGSLSYMNTVTPSAAATLANNAVFAYGYMNVDLAKFMKLTEQKIGLVVRGGWFDTNDNSYVSTTQYGSEDIGNAGVGAIGCFHVIASYSDLINFKFAMDPGVANDYYFALYHSKKYGNTTIAAEAVFDAAGVGLANGNLIVDGEVKPTMGDLALDVGWGIRYSLVGGAGAFNWGAGVAASYKTLARFRVGATGSDAVAVKYVVADVKFVPVPVMELYGAVKLAPMPSPFTFTGADFCAMFNVGAADLYVGAVVKAGNTWGIAAATQTIAPYVKMEVSF